MSENTMNELNKSWKDDVINGVEYTFKLLRYMLQERSQLYGIILNLMNRLEEKEVTLTIEDLNISAGGKYIYLSPDEEKQTLTLTVKEIDSGNTEGK